MPSKDTIKQHFCAIADRYDLVNHVLSFNCDRFWRRRLVRLADPKPDGHILDVCTGTGDILIDFYRYEPSSVMTGLDLTPAMLEIAQQKKERLCPNAQMSFIEGDAMALSVPDVSVDITSMGFGLRNLPDPCVGLKELYRVLKPQGRALVLEFAPAQKGLFGRFYGFYLKYLIPRIGGFITGSKMAYEHLADSIEGFFEPDRIVETMTEIGFKDVKAIALFGKIAYIYVGRK